jgi:hypothetical protein
MSRFGPRWSLIDAARGRQSLARNALERLPDLSAAGARFLRRSGYGQEDTEDITDPSSFGSSSAAVFEADPKRGRFRCCPHRPRPSCSTTAMPSMREGAMPLTVEFDELAQVDDRVESPEQAFTRLMGIVIGNAYTLAGGMEHAGKQEQFALLVAGVERADSGLHALADSLARPNTLSVQTHRMRQRLRQLVRRNCSDCAKRWSRSSPSSATPFQVP